MKPLVHKKVKRIRNADPVRQLLHITKGDTVQVISGDEKGKRRPTQGEGGHLHSGCPSGNPADRS